MTSHRVHVGLISLSMVLWVVGTYGALVQAPADRMMGDVYRIMYVHVPAAWMALVAYTVTCVASLMYLWKGHGSMDALAESSAEVGVVFNGLLVATGSLWGRPTWGVWWSWDPRLTTAAILLFSFVGYLSLRRFVDEPVRRATWAAVVAVVIFADVPVVWFSVKWWNSLHQLQSSPSTVAAPMAAALRLNALAFLSLYLWFLWLRYDLARQRQRLELQDPPVRLPC